MTQESNAGPQPRNPLSRTWLVSGRVQGVGFRYATRQRIAELGLSGEAVNLADGRVRVRASGPGEALDRLERWLWQGPSHAQVIDVETED